MNYHTEYPINCEWGIKGVQKYLDSTNIFIIVDVLSFSTCVDIAVKNEAEIIPYKYKNESSIEYAKSIDAQCASFLRSKENFSLSPCSLLKIKSGTKLVLPSPNGSQLSLSTKNTLTICGCLRNARSVGQYAAQHGKNITLIPAGEKWNDGSLRPAIEDLIGTGAILCHIKGNRSPECEMAIAVFKEFENNLNETLNNCLSGQELAEKGFEEDIKLASQINISSSIPLFKNGIYINAAR